ncbi:hypothetical protein ESCO_005635 [Escovopsis weberi]|uniref:Uncharacterized protein n=1 Tax=Escovopsis weberi TaxID=150374 RepID=A0A0M8MZ98_ESCWE|nr:hypothetical protein ESCO_005635 [Escovopsis weberi]
MRAFTVLSVLAATAMATTGTGGAHATGTGAAPGKPTSVPTNGASGISQNMVLMGAAAAVVAAALNESAISYTAQLAAGNSSPP